MFCLTLAVSFRYGLPVFLGPRWAVFGKILNQTSETKGPLTTASGLLTPRAAPILSHKSGFQLQVYLSNVACERPHAMLANKGAEHVQL